jgi:hypothetical protein
MHVDRPTRGRASGSPSVNLDGRRLVRLRTRDEPLAIVSVSCTYRAAETGTRIGKHNPAYRARENE